MTRDAALDWSPVWSHDGTHLYFASDRAGSMNLWRVNIDERSGTVLGRPEAITTPSHYTGLMSISRDGKLLAYVQQLSTANIQAVGFDPVNENIVSEPQWITRGSRQARHPDLSPDGEWLAFHDAGRQEDIFVVKTDGTELRQLTNDVYKDRYPRWSPDSRRIAFHSNRGGESDIWLINPDSGDRGAAYLHVGSGLLFSGLVPRWKAAGVQHSRRPFFSHGSRKIVERAITETGGSAARGSMLGFTYGPGHPMGGNWLERS